MPTAILQRTNLIGHRALTGRVPMGLAGSDAHAADLFLLALISALGLIACLLLGSGASGAEMLDVAGAWG